MGDSTKILTSAGVVEIGDYGDTTLNDIGYTQGGTTITKTRDTRRVEVDQTLYPVGMQVTAEGYEIHIICAETTYANLSSLWDEPGNGKLGLSAGGAPNYKKVKISGTRSDGTAVTWTFYKCMPTGFGAYEFAKDAEGKIEVTFTALWDDDEGALGEFSPASET